MKCTANKRDGTPCRVSALRDDPEHRCLFHTSLDFSAARRAGNIVTAVELVQTLGREIRRLQRDASLPAIARADAIKNLITLWREMTAPQAEPVPKVLTYEERVRLVDEEKRAADQKRR